MHQHLSVALKQFKDGGSEELVDLRNLNLQGLSQQLNSRKSEHCQDHPKLFITKWIDYSNKYGLGYQLRDGSVGVYFNDSTSIILAADNL